MKPNLTTKTAEALNTVANRYGWSVDLNGELRNGSNYLAGQIIEKKGRIRIYSNEVLRGSLSKPESLGKYLEQTYYATIPA